MSNRPIPMPFALAEPVAESAPPVVRGKLAAEELPRLLQVHGTMMYRVAYALLRHAQDAEDAVQDALLKLHRLSSRESGGERWGAELWDAAQRGGAQRGGAQRGGTQQWDQQQWGKEQCSEAIRDEKAYLARTVWRAAYDRMQSRVATPDDADAGLRLRDGRPSPEAAAAQGDEHGLLHQWIDELPEELRQPLLLSALEELNSREIAAMMGIPEGTVRTRLQRARLRLRNRYEALQPVPTTETQRPGETAVAGK